MVTIFFLPGPEQVPLVEDLEQIFMRSWRESHLSEIRQFQQPQAPAVQGRHYTLEVRHGNKHRVSLMISITNKNIN